MKKLNSFIAVLAILTLPFLLLCCKKELKDPYRDVAVNPAFEKDPPIATNITVTKLEKANEFGNLLFEARLPKEKIKANVLALLLNDSTKIVLHDDGKNGDLVAEDMIYSTILNIDEDSLTTHLNTTQSGIQKLLQTNKRLYRFAGRLMFPLSERTLASFKDVEKVNLTRRVPLIPISILPLLTPVDATLKHNSLTVTDPSVVNDPTRTFNPCTNVGTAGGAWTFGKLMTDMANTPVSGVSPENFVLNWLNTWSTNQTVNGDVIAARPSISSIINNWHTLSGGASAPLDINKAPFKLLAIVNRFDLRIGGGTYGGGNAGEGRFVFCATDAACNPTSFFVIFEYGVNKTTCSSIHAYAQQWVDLASIPLGSPAYNTALQNITDQFAGANTNPAKPNGSSLNQLRTNEIILGFPWELREFHIDSASHNIFNVTTKREPQIGFNSQGGASITSQVQAFGDFVNANERQIINDQMDLPNDLIVGGTPTPFVAGKAHTLDPFAFHWDAATVPGPGHILNDTARFHISLNTCSGCHGGETNSSAFTPFTQIGLPSTPGGEARLSKFLTGEPAFSGNPFLVADRANRPSAASPIQWPFNDLERRGRDLVNFTSNSCLPPFRIPRVEPLRMPLRVPEELARRLTFMPILTSH